MFPGLTLAYWVTLHGLVTALALALYAITSHVLRLRRHPDAAIAWVLFILLVPYVALPAYLAFGSRKRLRIPPPLVQSRPPDEANWVIQTALALQQPPPATFDHFELHTDGRAALAALWATIDGARHSLDICTFILGNDALGQEVLTRLIDKARVGVAVRLLLDDLGSWMAGRPDLAPLLEAGAEVRLFAPSWHGPFGGRTNLRNHRKLLIADAAQGTPRLWSGGRNLASEYFEGSKYKVAWHDLTFGIGGALVSDASALFEADWSFVGRSGRAPPVVSGVPPAPHTNEAGVLHGQLIASGPDQRDDTAHALIVTAAYRAEKRLVLVTPYFVPDESLLAALRLALGRGVRVELLIPARSNHAMSDIARRRALRSLAQAGATIELVPEMLHAKLVLVDATLALCGSANLDSRSFFLNYELMFAFQGAGEVAAFSAWYDQERVPSVRYEADTPGLLLDVAEGLVLWTGFQL